jgi:UDP-hydrolysing UDP-N-acetyl-D-glucosamine 2-epimerase
MRIVFITSSRSDFGLIRPTIKYVFGRDPAAVQLVTLGLACKLKYDYLRFGIGQFPISRIGLSTTRRNLENFHHTVIAFSHLCGEFSAWLGRQSGIDWLFAPGDRFEIFAAVVGGYYNNCPIAHIFGGDRSMGGHLDDNVRHAITKLAHIHFAVCKDSFQRLLRLGEEEWRVFNVGSPVVESVKEVLKTHKFTLDQLIRPRKKNVLCTYHPITTEPEDAGGQFDAILEAFRLVEQHLDVSFILTYPNNEYGSKSIIDRLQGLRGKPNYFVFQDLGWEDYLSVLARVDLVVGNSSSAILEAPIVGVPALNVGTRQQGRYSPPKVHHVEQYDPLLIAAKIEELLLGNRGMISHPYGNGTASPKIYDTLLRIASEKTKREIIQKKITY